LYWTINYICVYIYIVYIYISLLNINYAYDVFLFLKGSPADWRSLAYPDGKLEIIPSPDDQPPKYGSKWKLEMLLTEVRIGSYDQWKFQPYMEVR
jgi:hypothetical protein